MNDDIPIEHRLHYVLHNSIAELLRARPKSNAIPPKWPHEVLSKLKSEDDEKDLIVDEHAIVNANLNIILCLAAFIECQFESLLVAPFQNSDDKAHNVQNIPAQLLREDLIKISSLDKYYEYFHRLFGAKVGDVISADQQDCLQLLFSLRNMIIHASALKGTVVREADRAYMMIDDQFYMAIVAKVTKVLKLAKDYYCLPEQLLYCNPLADVLIANCPQAIESLIRYVAEHFRELEKDVWRDYFPLRLER